MIIEIKSIPGHNGEILVILVLHMDSVFSKSFWGDDSAFLLLSKVLWCTVCSIEMKQSFGMIVSDYR